MTVTLSEWDSKSLLGNVGFLPREMLTFSRDEAYIFAKGLGCPVVAKVSGPAHKTEGHGVLMNLTPDDVASSWDALASLGDGRVLVAEQVRSEYELIVGGLKDPQFGLLLMLGMGGVMAEVYSDVSFFLGPPSLSTTSVALGQLRAQQICHGYRGNKPLDVNELHALVLSISHVLEVRHEVIEMECNPVAVVKGRPVVLDALAVLCSEPDTLGESP